MQNFLQAGTTNISTDIACLLARNFLIESSQPLTDDEINVSLLDKAKLDKKHLDWMKQNPDSVAARQAFQLRERLRLVEQREKQRSTDKARIEQHRKQISKNLEGIENDEEPDVFMDDIGELQEQQERERELRFQRMLVEMQGDEDLDKDGGVNASSASESLEFDWDSPVLISTDFTSLKEIKEKQKEEQRLQNVNTAITASTRGVAATNPPPRKRGRFE